jgi:hypothetical protein
MVRPPLAVLGAGAIYAALLSWLLADELVEHLGYAVAWSGYALSGALFLWLDKRGLKRLPDRKWASSRSMWRETWISAAAAIGLALLVEPTIVAIFVALASWPILGGTTAWLAPFVFLYGVGLLVVIMFLFQLATNLRSRVRTSIG